MRSGNTNKEKSDFKPSLTVLLRVTKIILESGSMGKTSLAQEAKINYPRLVKHLDWLTKKHLVEAVLKDDKVRLKLTEKGREIAIILCDSDFTV